eukprot:1194674-Prorocentrum_minimum.AAC.3
MAAPLASDIALWVNAGEYCSNRTRCLWRHPAGRRLDFGRWLCWVVSPNTGCSLGSFPRERKA